MIKGYIQEEDNNYKYLCTQHGCTSIHKKNTKQKKQFKYDTIDSHQITREENKRGREAKGPTKTNPKQLTK